MLAAVAVLLVAMQVSHAAVCGPGQNPAINSCSCQFGFAPVAGACVKDMFLNYANIALLIMFGLLGIMYMMARLVDNPRITNFVHNEIYQTIGTAVILMACWSLITILNNVIAPLFYNSSIIAPAYSGARLSCPGVNANGGWADAQSHVRCYLAQVKNDATSSAGSFVSLAAVAGAVGSASYQLQILVASLYVTPFSVFGSLTNVIAAVLGFIVASITTLQLQIQLLNMADALFFTLLPLGVVFRSFTLTRALGNSMIAVSIGFSVVLPTMYLILEDVAMYYYTGPGHCNGRPSPTISGLAGAGFSIGAGGANQVISTINTQFSTGGTFSCLAFLIAMETTIFPFIGYTFSLGIMKKLAEIFGSPIDFSSIVRFI